MSSSSLDPAQVTRLLHRIDEGDDVAREELMRVVYEDLHGLARVQMLRHGRGDAEGTLQPTALVHETYLRLIKQRERFDGRAHFFHVATTLMIRVLRDHHRRRHAAKRGGKLERASFDLEVVPGHDVERSPSDRALALLDALERLERIDARKAEVVELRVLWGLTHDEIATTLGVGRATVDRDWQFARVWLAQQVEQREGS
ncbi:MAG: sigma-70 family RNA polymerase sigma factor [Planctomycetes bacterium]|nr:sigma-70 family RNA polymerase sigma factor [Planctomycetota bacterium]